MFDGNLPSVLRERLGTVCPPFLLLAGTTSWLATPGLGVVGSLTPATPASTLLGVPLRWPSNAGCPAISGLARGVDQVAWWRHSMPGEWWSECRPRAFDKVSRNAEIRRRVHGGDLCMASPFGPDVPFQASNAMGRNKIIYALSRLTFVASSDRGSGGTWAGAKEAIDKRYAPVAVWTGHGSRDGDVWRAEAPCPSPTSPISSTSIRRQAGLQLS